MATFLHDPANKIRAQHINVMRATDQKKIEQELVIKPGMTPDQMGKVIASNMLNIIKESILNPALPNNA